MAINVKNKIKVLGIILFGIISVSLASCGSDTEVKGDNIIVTENGTKTIENKKDKEESNTQNKENNVTNNESKNQEETQTQGQTETNHSSQAEVTPANTENKEVENQPESQPESDGYRQHLGLQPHHSLQLHQQPARMLIPATGQCLSCGIRSKSHA